VTATFIAETVAHDVVVDDARCPAGVCAVGGADDVSVRLRNRGRTVAVINTLAVGAIVGAGAPTLSFATPRPIIINPGATQEVTLTIGTGATGSYEAPVTLQTIDALIGQRFQVTTIRVVGTR
jgi:hypothetical protein